MARKRPKKGSTWDPLQRAYADPFLCWFRVRDFPGFFSLSANPRARSISITAQIDLAMAFVRRARQLSLIGPQRPLLVVGGGAAGVSAALTAAKAKVPVALRETSNRLFSRQANCKTRWLHPHQYDWPQAWFAEREFPRPNERGFFPLRWRADFADAIAAQWQERYDYYKGKVTLREWLAAPPLQEEDDYIELAKQCDVDLANRQIYPFAVYLFCRGFAEENSTIGQYSGFRFWDTDPYEQPRAGLSTENPAEILIAGIGDGGMQDLIRFVFGSTRPVDLIRIIDEELNGSADKKAWDAFITELLKRCDSRSAPRIKDGDDVCERFVFPLSRSTIAQLFAKLRPLIVMNFSTDWIRIISERDNLPTCFPLNRILTLLIDRFASDELVDGGPIVETGIVNNIRGRETHTCNNNPAECHGVSHDARVGRQPTTCNVLVVRHGPAAELRPVELRAGKTES